MTKRGKIQSGRILFDEPIDLPDGTEVFLHIEPVEESGPSLERIPFTVIFNDLSANEKTLIRMILLEELSIAEAARALSNPLEEVAGNWNRVRSKLRARARRVIQGTNLDNPSRRRKVSSKRATNKEATNGDNFESLAFFGMWADRDDMSDTGAWVRREREKGQQRLTPQR